MGGGDGCRDGAGGCRAVSHSISHTRRLIEWWEGGSRTGSRDQAVGSSTTREQDRQTGSEPQKEDESRTITKCLETSREGSSHKAENSMFCVVDTARQASEKQQGARRQTRAEQGYDKQEQTQNSTAAVLPTPAHACIGTG
ncbi:hypothetical protein BGZ61DRAFT_18722 [Ilyonectria robusta]|uniref:uncharacterized protein n=1 Tax=Ilyonectria robusta TaxID=1079257 RepID=UPI001E8EA4C6|nr:uncharacterized protein BGZ61DRAFT_18722 [Ilyonectria robusta]KAH8737598.1 hypothetical protein BGZ61DRAFT_18722 [Ilyonectria robusta]